MVNWKAGALPDLAAPDNDRGALENDVRDALKRRAVRSAASAEARLGRKKIKTGSNTLKCQDDTLSE
jgi:hypothetical protein